MTLREQYRPDWKTIGPRASVTIYAEDVRVLVDCGDSPVFGAVNLPATKFKRLLLSGPPFAEGARDSSVPSATRFLDSF